MSPPLCSVTISWSWSWLHSSITPSSITPSPHPLLQIFLNISFHFPSRHPFTLRKGSVGEWTLLSVQRRFAVHHQGKEIVPGPSLVPSVTPEQETSAIDLLLLAHIDYTSPSAAVQQIHRQRVPKDLPVCKGVSVSIYRTCLCYRGGVYCLMSVTNAVNTIWKAGWMLQNLYREQRSHHKDKYRYMLTPLHSHFIV